MSGAEAELNQSHLLCEVPPKVCTTMIRTPFFVNDSGKCFSHTEYRSKILSAQRVRYSFFLPEYNVAGEPAKSK